MIFMTKRGSMLVFISIITLVIGIFVGVMYPQIAKTYSKLPLKTAASRDIALILDTMYAYPYDIEIEYGYDLSDFIVLISEEKVKISEGGTDPSPAEYPFVPIGNVEVITLTNPEKIIFKKENGVLTVNQ